MGEELDAQRQARKRSLRIAIIFFVVTTLFFAGGALFLIDQATRGAFVSWKKMDPPPDPAVDLQIVGSGEVLVQTTAGRRYRWAEWDTPPWQEVTEPLDDSSSWMACEPGQGSAFVVANPPGKVLKRVETTCPLLDMGQHIEAVLLETGEVWRWNYSSVGTTATIFRVIALVGGIGLSMLLSGLVYVLSSISWRRGG